MQEWRIDNQTIYEIGPLEEYLAALGFAAGLEGEEQRFVVAVGDAGTGKTVGARIFCRDRKPRPLYVRLTCQALLNPRSLLHSLAEPLGLPWDVPSRYDIAARIAQDSLSRPRLLVLDEAQALAKGGLLDILRWLHDEGGHTFALVGLPGLEYAMAEHRQFGSRVALRHQLRLPTPAEIAPLFDGFPEDAVGRIYDETGGHMRQVMALRRRLLELVKQRKCFPEEVTSRQISTVAKHFLVRAA
jgi:DNA transposition AAA+ family ATPase